MNKKFSTLLAGAALLGAVTANGAVKLNQGANNGLYQLKAGSAFLSIPKIPRLTKMKSKWFLTLPQI